MVTKMKIDSSAPQRRRKRPWQPPELPAQRHDELFSLERLEEYARELASEHKAIATRRAIARPLLAEAEKNKRILEEAYAELAQEPDGKRMPMPGDDWLLDNYHIVRDTTAEIAVDLPRRYYLQLPRLGGGPWQGYPRIYASMREIILHKDGIVDITNVEAFIRGYQSVLTLNLGELWAAPAMIRLALVENLAGLARALVAASRQMEAANAWAERIREMASLLSEDPSASSSPDATITLPPELKRNTAQVTPVFVTRLLQNLRDAEPAVMPVVSWLEEELAKAGSSPDEAIRAEFGRQSALQASIANTISSMRGVAATKWADFVERQSAVEGLLRTDPTGLYAQMDFATRDRYRHAVERIARRCRKPETVVTEQVLHLARASKEANPDDLRRAHVGYYLTARGVQQLRVVMGYRSRLGETLSRFVRGYPTTVYVGSILAVNALGLVTALLFGFTAGGSSVNAPWIALALLLAFFPASELASRLVNLAVTLLLPPRVLPKLDLSGGVPAEQSAFVAIPTLLMRVEDVRALIEHLEVLYLANPDPNLRFAILSDFADAPLQEMPGDAELLKLACDGVQGLNAKYGGSGADAGAHSSFYLLHRKRQWNPKEGPDGKGIWMGWERKRGKLADFNALLRGRGGESFTTRVGDLTSIAETRYVIALDSDTDLPRNAARRLVGTLAHPLNRAEIDPQTRIVSTGYGILQPRVETTWDSAGSTPFARLFSGHTGVDPYTTAVSNAYQDLFGEGIFIGKGIYEVDAFEETTRGRFPKDAILSHDLLEGVYARVGLVSDIELFEDFPSSYNAYAARSHRWVRGDWQIAGWLLPRVSSGRTTGGSGNSSGSGATERNTLTPINRWKIGDNLRRSLVAPAYLLLLGLAWLAPLFSPIFWTVSLLLVYAFPLYTQLLTAIPRKPAGTRWSRHLSAVWEDAGVNLLQLLLTLTFLAHTAYLMLDAAIRTLARMLITHRERLEWVTASEAQRTLGSAPLDFVRRMWQAPAIAASLCFLFVLESVFSGAMLRPETILIAAPFLAAWALSPIVAYLVSTPRAPMLYTMTEEERLYLRRVARKTWRFFEEFVGEKDRWLAPDNFQEYPKGGLAHRTSPTNLGLLLLSTLSAYDLGYITISEMVARTDRTLSSMEKLERYNGHFYNWYDTRSGQPLPPKYISSVDSGNLAGHLLALKNGCAELLRAPIFSPQMAQHLRDLTRLMERELGALRVERRSPLQTTQRLTLDGIAALVEKIAVQAQSTPQTMLEWAEWTNSLVQPTTDLATEVRRLVGGRGWEPDSKQVQSADVNNRRASSLEDLAYWADSLARAVRSLEQEIGNVAPWASMLASPPALLVDGARPEIAAHWARLRKLQGVPSYSDILQWCAAATPEIRRLRAFIRDGNVGMANSQTDAESETAAALRWLEMLSQRVSSAWAASEFLLGRLTKAANRANSMAKDMKFGFLYDEERKLFSIGYNVAELRRDDSYYDLLASEARLGSYVAIASGQVEQSHWFGMARPTTGRGRKLALLSWTGTMFEYLMPNLVMPVYSGSLLDQTCAAAVRYQEQHGRENGVPWGFSEAAYNALDSSENYKYRAFGLPELGIKRGLSEDLVVAPYATQLALSVAPRQALANMRRLSSLGLEGRYGFYDSIDFTRARRTSEQHGDIVGTYMVHHLGMGLVATNNSLNNEPMVRRFQAEPEARATLLLLQERVPRQVSTAQPHSPEGERGRAERNDNDTPPIVRSYTTPNTDVARAHLISNGRYSVMITNSGAGYSRLGMGSSALAVTRWRNDWVRDAYGTFIYISDPQSGAVWSAAAAPFGGEPAGYRAHFGLDKAEFFRLDGEIETHMEVVVSPEDDAEIRRVTLSNRGSRTREIELTSYAEIALAAQSADEAHPAFSKLFIETEYFPGCGALLASRRPKAADEQRKWLVHVAAILRQDGTTSAGTTGHLTTGHLVPPPTAEYETDRMAFLGRGGTAASARAMKPGQRLGNSQGAVLDPIFSLRRKVRIEPGMRVQVSFVTLAAETKEEAYSLADKYHDPTWTERAVVMSLAQARLELRMLDISLDGSMQYQRIFSRMVYPQRGTSPSDATLAKNSKGQQGLWAYAISGDLPILLVRVADLTEAPLVRQALRAHEYWQRNGFEAELVILNEYPGGYIQPVQDELERLVSASDSHQVFNKPGGVFVKRADIMPEADRILLNSVARVVLVGSRGTLDAQLDREVPEAPLPPLLRLRSEVPITRRVGVRTEASSAKRNTSSSNVAPSSPPARPSHPHGVYSSPHSSFTPDGHEYIMTLAGGEWTPLPWSNVIANRRFGCLVTESGMASTWSANSRENRLTPWSNDPTSDPPSEVIYVRDDDTGAVMSPTPLPVRDGQPYTIRHGQGYTVYSHDSNGIEQTLRVSVPPDDPVKVCKLTLRNASSTPRKLSATYYAELVMGVSREATSRYIITQRDQQSGALFARNPYNNEFAERMAFAATSAASFAFTTDRAAFLGRNGSTSSPQALKRQGLSGRVGAGLDPCFVLQCAMSLQPGEERDVTFILGEADDAGQAGLLATKYCDPAQAEAEYTGTVAMWDRILSAVEVETPDAGMNLLTNRWLLYQSVSCRIWGRTAFYQSGGAYGFRDQLQDVMALIYAAPEIAREQILLSAARQFKEGDVQHWWHPPTGRGVRTRFSDDLLWLPFVTAYYVSATGDAAILDEKMPFLQAPLLTPDQEDMYGTPAISEEVGDLYEHCLRAIKHGTTTGAHGLPLMGGGDWNDGMNRVGIGGKGESVWVGWFLYATLKNFAPLCEARNDRESAARLRAEMARLQAALEKTAWDGEWYLRAFYDSGEPLGSAQSQEAQIDSIAQSWGIISGAADKSRAERAMRSVSERLVLEQEKMILLFTPPFDKTPLNPGYIKGYIPGVRENGGQYTHGAIWAAVARVLMGDGDGAYRLFEMLSPINHVTTPEMVEQYKTEPYVIAADIYSHPQHIGRGGWTWYTGSASWFYRLGVEYILGLKLHGDHLTIEPCIPSQWRGYKLTYRHRTASYHITITIENEQGGTSRSGTVELDGSPLPDGKVPLLDDGKRHEVRVALGDERAREGKIEALRASAEQSPA